MIKRALSRRGFFGAAPAAALAGPSLVAAATQETGAGGAEILTHEAPVGYAGYSSEIEGARNYVASLRDAISGKKSDEHIDRLRHFNRLALAAHFDGLRSVAPSQRARLYEESLVERSVAYRKREAERSLAEAMKRYLKRGWTI